MPDKLPSYAVEPMPASANPSLRPISVRNHQHHALELLKAQGVESASIRSVVELGGSVGANIRSRFTGDYLNIDIAPNDALPTIVADVTKHVPIEDATVDFIYTNNCFEHLSQPWLAAKELSRILKPGGWLYCSAPWSWRYHPVPIDYWRFSPSALEFLFSDLRVIESGFNLAFRRDDIKGFWPNRMDAVPVDEMGGFRENWLSYYFGQKGE